MRSELERLSEPDIEQLIPHRRPFMFLKSAEIVKPGVHATGELADLSHPDFDFLKGHFPGDPVVPGVILTEALAQLSGVARVSGTKADTNKIGFLRRDRMDYKQPVKPGDSVQLEVEIIRFRMNVGVSKVKATKDGKIAAEGEITFFLIDKPDVSRPSS